MGGFLVSGACDAVVLQKCPATKSYNLWVSYNVQKQASKGPEKCRKKFLAGRRVPLWMQVVFALSLISWLAIIAVADSRRMEVSNWLTVPMVAVGILAACGQARSPIPLGIAALMLALAEIPLPWWSLLPVMVSLLIALPAWEAMIWGWGIAVSLWKSGVLGGADAKVIMALTALIPDMRLVWLLVGCWALVDAIRLIVRFRRQAVRQLFQALKTGSGTQVPALPALAVGGTVYLLVAWASGSTVLPWRFP